ncbi:MAG: hypothetical protein R2697_11080 [Ilumatobacteraceae bacterium]
MADADAAHVDDLGDVLVVHPDLCVTSDASPAEVVVTTAPIWRT